MSLILEALNRSQRERDNARKVPGVETQHWVEPPPYSSRWQRGLPWLALVMALGVIAWLLFDDADKVVESPTITLPSQTIAQRSPGEEAQNQAVAAPVAAPASKLQANIPVVSDSVVPKPAAIAPTPVHTKLDAAENNRTDSSAVADLYSRKVVEKVAAEAAPATVAQTPAAEISTRSTLGGATSEQTIDIEEVIARAKEEAKNAELDEHSAPFLSSLSQRVKDTIPTVYYSRHDYSSNMSQSSVTLNGVVVRAGGRVVGNLKLVEILPGSIVLSQQGVQFRLRALNSWINL